MIPIIEIILFIIAAGIIFANVTLDGSKAKNKFVDYKIRFSGAFMMYFALLLGIALIDYLEIQSILRKHQIERTLTIEKANRLSIREKEKINKYYEYMNKIIFKEENE